MKKNKGFTLVELLVAMTIMGILLVLAIPTVGNIIASNKEKKIEAYKIALERAAKLYIDEREREEFKHYDGCINIIFERLKDANLVKKLNDKDITCDYDNTFVNVTKYNDTFKYNAVLNCRDERRNKSYSDDTGKCNYLDNDDVGPTISLSYDGDTSEWTTTKNAGNMNINLSDDKLGFTFDKKIRYQWVKNGNEINNSNWKKLNLRNNELQKDISVQLDKNRFPKEKQGEYKLCVNKNDITDVVGNNKYSTDPCSNFVKLDDVAPTCEITKPNANSYGWYNSNITFTFTHSDGEGSGVKAYDLRQGTSQPNINSSNANSKNSDSISTENNGTINEYGYVEDNAGNIKTCSKGGNKLDKTAPDVYVYTGGPTGGGDYCNSGGFIIKNKLSSGYSTGNRIIRCDDVKSNGITSGVWPGSLAGDISANGEFHRGDGFNSNTFISSDRGNDRCGTHSGFDDFNYCGTHYIVHTYKANGTKNSTYECEDKAGNKIHIKFEDASGKHKKARCVCRRKSNDSIAIDYYDKCTVWQGNLMYSTNCDCDEKHETYDLNTGKGYLSCY